MWELGNNGRIFIFECIISLENNLGKRKYQKSLKTDWLSNSNKTRMNHNLCTTYFYSSFIWRSWILWNLTHSVQIRKMLSLLRPVTYLVQIHHNSCRQNNLFYYLSVQNTDLLPDYSSSEHWIMLLPTGYFFIRFQMFSTSLFTLQLCTNLKYTHGLI